MGPGDPFAPRPASTASPDAPANGAPEAGPVRIQARLPEPPPTPRGPARNAATTGAAVGLALGLLFVFLTPGQAVLVLVLTALGAVLGVIVKNAFADGIDPAGAWRALRRR